MNAEDEIKTFAIEAGARMLPSLIDWAAKRIAGGNDPEAELRVLLDAGDVIVDKYQERELGPR